MRWPLPGCRRFVIFPLFFLSSAFLQGQDSGCRDLSTQIWYDIIPPRHAASATIINSGRSGGAPFLVVAQAGDFYASSNAGQSWARLANPGLDVTSRWQGHVIAPSDPKTIYRNDYGPLWKIERSQDGGKTWIHPTVTVDGLSEADAASRLSRDRDYGLEFRLTAIHPQNPLTIFATILAVPPRKEGGEFREHYPLKGMYISDDGGENWHRFTDQVGIFDRYPRHVVIGIDPADPKLMFAEGQHGILHSTDGGTTWLPVGQSELLNQGPVDVEDREEGVWVNPRKSVLNVKEFIFDPSSTSVVYMRSRKGIHRTLDGGNTWQLLNLGFDRLDAVNSFAVDTAQPNQLFAGTDRGLFVSDDQGCSFHALPLPSKDN